MTREKLQNKDSCCPSHKNTQSRFAPRPFAPLVEEHEAQATEPGIDFSLSDISIFPRETVQPKLRLGHVGDKYEQEADRVARQVVETISSPDQDSVQRQEDLEDEDELDLEEEELRRKVDVSSAVGGADVGPEFESAIQRARSIGQPLSDGVRQPMERAFGADFGRVRVHTDGQADSLNRSIQARAFTTGQDVFLRQGEYRPGSFEGQRLLAHELTHVVQQSNGLVIGNMVLRTDLQSPKRISNYIFTNNIVQRNGGEGQQILGAWDPGSQWDYAFCASTRGGQRWAYTTTFTWTVNGRKLRAHVHYYTTDSGYYKVRGKGWISGINNFDFSTPDVVVQNAPVNPIPGDL